MTPGDFTIRFSLPLDDSALSANISARAEISPCRSFYLVHSFRNSNTNNPVHLESLSVKKITRGNKSYWIHTDSELPSALSMAIGSSIEAVMAGNNMDA